MKTSTPKKIMTTLTTLPLMSTLLTLAQCCRRSLLTTFKALIVGLCIVTHVAAQTSTVTYFHNDLAGSPVAASDSSGTIIWRESYRPYGERLTNASASQDNSQWYTGHRQDAESGLVYMGARHYDPLIGRFLSIDPAPFTESNPHSFNRYAYANNNPVKFVDPDGRAGVLVLGLGVLLVGGAIIVSMPADKRIELAQQLNSFINSSKNVTISPLPLGNMSESKDEGATAAGNEKNEKKPDREQRPEDVPAGTKPIDQDKRLDRPKIHDIKRQIGAGAKDWVGIDRDGNIWINEGGTGANQGPYQDYINVKKGEQ
jgi:RHS repeat-associated protein